jgi:peptide deformylase
MGEPILRQLARTLADGEFGSSSLDTLISDLIDTMRAADGAGLAAPQIFEPVSVCVLEVERNPRYPTFPRVPLTVLVNPVVEPIEGSGVIGLYEGCLSVPGLRGRVSRPDRVRLRARTPSGDTVDRVVEGVEAAIVQHEVDHLYGRLFVDHAESTTLTFLEEYQRYVAPVDAASSD